jgi:hypothetical protein
LASALQNATGEGAPVDDFVALCNATNADLWYNLPLKDDGTYVTGLAQYLAANLNSNLNVRIELANELWNGVGVGGGTYANFVYAYVAANPGVLDWDAGQSSYNATYSPLYRYYGKRMYEAYVAFSSAFGPQYANRVKLVLAWQQGGFGAFTGMMEYIQHYHPTTPISTVLGALSVAPYETRDNTNVPGDGVNHVNETGDSVSTIQAQLTANGNYIALTSHSENVALMAMHYGLSLEAYEGGGETAGESSATNYGLAIMDSGMAAVVSSYLQNQLNSGFSRLNWTAFGVSNFNSPGSDPGYALSSDYSALITTGSPRLSGVKAVNTGGVVYTRNVVSTGTSTIDSINYADNVVSMSSAYPYLGKLNSYAQGSYYGTGGYIGYIINCTVAGNYTVSAVFTANSAGTTNFEWGSPGNAGLNHITTGITIPAGSNVTVPLGTVALAQGPNYILLGNGTTYSAITPKSLQFSTAP